MRLCDKPQCKLRTGYLENQACKYLFVCWTGNRDGTVKGGSTNEIFWYLGILQVHAYQKDPGDKIYASRLLRAWLNQSTWAVAMTAPSVASIILMVLGKRRIIWEAPQPNANDNLLPWSPAANTGNTVQGLKSGWVWLPTQKQLTVGSSTGGCYVKEGEGKLLTQVYKHLTARWSRIGNWA